jgi:hypothetical protein
MTLAAADAASPATNLDITSTPTPDALEARNRFDIARLESLNLSPEDIDIICRIWAPSQAPPTRNFTRTVNVGATFGYLKESDAQAALDSAAPFPDDPKMQHQYETFLDAQVGKSKDHYTVFFAMLSDFNERNELFVEAARAAVASRATHACAAEATYDDNAPPPVINTEREALRQTDGFGTKDALRFC